MKEPKTDTPETQPQEGESSYSSYWDSYVKGWYDKSAKAWGSHEPDPEGMDWPGDEWGNPDFWKRIFKELFVPAGVETWERAVEIGPGSGKYTLPVIERSQATVRAYDVSPEYMKICRERCADQIEAGRLQLELLDTRFPGYMLGNITENGWKGKVDGFFSIAAMVHVDLQYLIAYMLTAARALRPDGKLILTLATATNEKGFHKLIDDIAFYWRAQGQPGGSAKYEWLSKDMVESVLSNLGFEMDVLSDEHRDLMVVASLADPEKSEHLEPYLFPALKQKLGL